MNAFPLVLGLAASVATLGGGWLTLRFGRGAVLVPGLTAGVVLGAAVFDLVPEARDVAAGRWSSGALVGWVAVGLGLYLLLDRALGRMDHLPGHWRAQLGPATLTLHSLFDGMGIGLAFQIDAKAGWLVALAVLTHDVADGVNTVGLCLSAQTEKVARRWLILNGAAPPLGVLIGTGVSVPAATLAPLLAAFAGGFLYLGVFELLPRSQARDPRLRTAVASLAGMALMAAVTSVAR